MSLLWLKDVSVKVTDTNRLILNKLNLKLEKGNAYVLFGPNGSGKSTLLSTIAGLPNFKLVSGSILFRGKDITKLDVSERAKLGICLGFQMPPEVSGLKLSQLIKICADKSYRASEIRKITRKFKLEKHLSRDVNLNFSGGERKRAELLQLLLMMPKLMLLDEPDSGVDIESLELIGDSINNYVKKGGTALIVTHHGNILKHMRARHGFVLIHSSIQCQGNPFKILKNIAENGYDSCVKCKKTRI